MVSRLILQTLAWVVVMALILFGPAGTVRWAGAWVFLAEMLAGGITIGLWLARHDPALLKERLGPVVQRKQESWDKIFIISVFAIFIIWLVLMGFDTRYHWSHVPVLLQALGAAATIATFIMSWLVFRENSYAAPVVKVQSERAHRVITTGPYRFLRHPMYAGALFFFIGTPLLLGSWAGLAMAPVLTVMLAIRIVLEERTLRRELEGYAAYAARVRWRLIPGVW